ncbi:Spy/CpxP family protein refolding chaperone [Thiocapsa sp.]|uniref:Spy/CpxP family protein refolding chaperone n=1 Tax=Thiocapsa sp. TaxID=2024551 RepID=UPI0035934782
MTTRSSIQTAALALAVSGLFAAHATLAGPCAQGRAPEAFASQRIERMTERLDLTAEQQGVIRAILDEQQAESERQRAETRARVNAVLTPEQLARIDEQRDARVERHLDRLAGRLVLSTEQVAQVRTIMQAKGDDPEMARDEVREQIKAVLTEEQRSTFESMGAGAKRGGPGKPCGLDNARGPH